MRLVVLSIALCVGMTGCDLLASGPSNQVDVFEAQLAFDRELVPEGAIVAPDTVSVGERFEVTVHTIGGGCTVYARTESEQTAEAFVIRPFNKTTGQDICTREIRVVPHTVETSALSSGRFLVRAIGAGGLTFNRRVVVR